MLRKLIIAVLTVLTLFPTLIFARESELNLEQEKINPGNTIFVVKRAIEKIQGKLLFSQEKKVAFNDKLVRIRLSELNYLVENKNLTPVEQASYRLSAQAGVFTDELVKLNKKEEIEKTLKWFALYEAKLAELRDNFPANSSNWLLLQQNIDTFQILAKKIS